MKPIDLLLTSLSKPYFILQISKPSKWLLASRSEGLIHLGILLICVLVTGVLPLGSVLGTSFLISDLTSTELSLLFFWVYSLRLIFRDRLVVLVLLVLVIILILGLEIGSVLLISWSILVYGKHVRVTIRIKWINL